VLDTTRNYKCHCPLLQPESVQEYFHSQAGAGMGITSDHTLARLQTPRMDQEALTVALTGVSLGYAEERKQLLEEHRDAFPRWMYNLWYCHCHWGWGWGWEDITYIATL